MSDWPRPLPRGWTDQGGNPDTLDVGTTILIGEKAGAQSGQLQLAGNSFSGFNFSDAVTGAEVFLDVNDGLLIVVGPGAGAAFKAFGIAGADASFDGFGGKSRNMPHERTLSYDVFGDFGVGFENIRQSASLVVAGYYSVPSGMTFAIAAGGVLAIV